MCIYIYTSLGVIGQGTTNAQWYQLGPRAPFSCPWLPDAPFSCHPDYPSPDVTGKMVPGIKEALDIVTRYNIVYLCIYMVCCTCLL